MSTSIRREVVDLLLDIDHAVSKFPLQLVHRDGERFTPGEAQLALDANWDEVQAVRDYYETAVEFATSKAADYERLGELVAPYFAQLPDATFADIEPLLTPEHRVEFLAIKDRLAPDGYIVT